jgi:hypothetical protein
MTAPTTPGSVACTACPAWRAWIFRRTGREVRWWLSSHGHTPSIRVGKDHKENTNTYDSLGQPTGWMRRSSLTFGLVAPFPPRLATVAAVCVLRIGRHEITGR